jgi:hypothetical protein
MPFEIPKRQYTFEEFKYIIQSMRLPPNARFKIACYFTWYKSWEGGEESLERVLSKKKIQVEDFGEIKRLRTSYKPKDFDKPVEIEFYAYLYPDTKLLICMTDAETEGIEKTLDRIARDTIGFSFFFINTSTFDYISKEITEKDKDNCCIYFSARYLDSYKNASEIRPSVGRTIQYYGMDGLEAVKELRTSYGVLPTIMRFKIVDIGAFDVKYTGLFTIDSSIDDKMAREEALSLVNETLNYVLRQKRIIESSGYWLIPVKTEKKTFEVPRVIPWIINFSKPIEDEDRKLLSKILEKEGFTLYNSLDKTGGSFTLSGMVIDLSRFCLFTVDISNNQIIVAPYVEPIFDSFMNFYQAILEKYDADATIMEYRENE